MILISFETLERVLLLLVWPDFLARLKGLLTVYSKVGWSLKTNDKGSEK